MNVKHVIVTAVVLLAVMMFVTAPPAGSDKQNGNGKSVTLIGCPAAGVMPFCVMLKGKDQVNYNISAAAPMPPVGDVAVRVTGTVTDKVSLCMQGAVLDNIKWTKTRQKCPKT